MALSSMHFLQCIITLESSLQHLQKAKANSVDYEIFRNAVVKGFELTLETAGKLLRKALKLYTGNPRMIDGLTYKEVLRYATKHALLEPQAVERWFKYRDNRNNTAHDYGINFAEETLLLLPDFIEDAKTLQLILKEKLNDSKETGS